MTFYLSYCIGRFFMQLPARRTRVRKFPVKLRLPSVASSGEGVSQLCGRDSCQEKRSLMRKMNFKLVESKQMLELMLENNTKLIAGPANERMCQAY